MLDASTIIRSYHHVSPNLFLPEVVDAFRQADEEVWVGQTQRSHLARSWLKIYSFARSGKLLLQPKPLWEAAQRAILDLAEEILQRQGGTLSARWPVFITTGRVSDQSGLARRTIQELFAERHVQRLFHPTEGEIWMVREAEAALAKAGWAHLQGKPVRGKPGEHIVLQGGGQYHRASSNVEPVNPEVVQTFCLALSQGGGVPLLTNYGYTRVRQDWFALGIIIPKGGGWIWSHECFRRGGRCSMRKTRLVRDWQQVASKALPWDPFPVLFRKEKRIG